LRRYMPTESFRSLFERSPERILAWLRSGMGDGLDLKRRRSVPCESAGELVSPDLETLAVITRAIAARQLIRVRYLSLTSGASTKTLAPLALADTGLRWHLRAFDREKKRFADLVLTRIDKARPLGDPIPEAESLESDIQWARVVRLELVPHPGLEHPSAIESDYGMKEGALQLKLRAPLVGYALMRWGVDCTTDHRMDPKAHHLWLRNGQTLYGVESAALAPGYVVSTEASASLANSKT
jgi:predicted DNA-binding transcriptional regulator YafY